MQLKIEELEESLKGGDSSQEKLKVLNRELEFQCDELMEQLENGDAARKNLKGELGISNQRIIDLEEELYGLK